MGTRTYATTNARLAEVIAMVNELIDWAEADAEHALDNDAPDTARDDRRRAKTLRRARELLKACER
jgi:hypothetical protein